TRRSAYAIRFGSRGGRRTTRAAAAVSVSRNASVNRGSRVAKIRRSTRRLKAELRCLAMRTINAPISFMAGARAERHADYCPRIAWRWGPVAIVDDGGLLLVEPALERDQDELKGCDERRQSASLRGCVRVGAPDRSVRRRSDF